MASNEKLRQNFQLFDFEVDDSLQPGGHCRCGPNFADPVSFFDFRRKTSTRNAAGCFRLFFSNSGRTTNWGNTVGTDTVAGTGSGVAQTLTVYGQIPASQFVRSGSYTDTVVATVTY